jgi:DNA-binding response OmpR family regulator
MARVLVVDDDRTARASLGSRLGALGHDVVYASDGEAALREAQAEQLDLVLLDLGLPTGDSFLVLEHLRALPGGDKRPVIVFSAADRQLYRERALEAGALDFFEKTEDFVPLLRAVQRALGGTYTRS